MRGYNTMQDTAAAMDSLEADSRSVVFRLSRQRTKLRSWVELGSIKVMNG